MSDQLQRCSLIDRIKRKTRPKISEDYLTYEYKYVVIGVKQHEV